MIERSGSTGRMFFNLPILKKPGILIEPGSNVENATSAGKGDRENMDKNDVGKEMVVERIQKAIRQYEHDSECENFAFDVEKCEFKCIGGDGSIVMDFISELLMPDVHDGTSEGFSFHRVAMNLSEYSHQVEDFNMFYCDLAISLSSIIFHNELAGRCLTVLRKYLKSLD